MTDNKLHSVERTKNISWRGLQDPVTIRLTMSKIDIDILGSLAFERGISRNRFINEVLQEVIDSYV